MQQHVTDSSVESVSVSASGSGYGGGGGGGGDSSAALEAMRAAAGWLCGAGRPPAAALLAVRAPAARSALAAFKEYLRSRALPASPLLVGAPRLLPPINIHMCSTYLLYHIVSEIKEHVASLRQHQEDKQITKSVNITLCLHKIVY